MEAVRRLRDVFILTMFMLSIFALIGLQLYHGKLLRRCVREADGNWLRLADNAAKKAFDNNLGYYYSLQFFFFLHCYPAPDRDLGTGYCFRSISLFLCFFVCFFVSKITRKRLDRFA